MFFCFISISQMFHTVNRTWLETTYIYCNVSFCTYFNFANISQINQTETKNHQCLLQYVLMLHSNSIDVSQNQQHRDKNICMLFATSISVPLKFPRCFTDLTEQGQKTAYAFAIAIFLSISISLSRTISILQMFYIHNRKGRKNYRYLVQ